LGTPWNTGGFPLFLIMAYGAFTTKLEAVNQMLSTIGQSRVSTLVGVGGDAAEAILVLDEIDKEVQSEGWHFNKFYSEVLARGTATGTATWANNAWTSTTATYLSKGETITFDGANYVVATVTADTKGFTLTPATNPGTGTFSYSKRVATPSTALSIDTPTGVYDPIVRGRFLYDKAKASYEFDADLTVSLTYLIPFEQSDAGEPSLPEYARRYISTKAARVYAGRFVGDPQLIQTAAQSEAQARAIMIHKETELADTNIFQSPLAFYTVNRNAVSNVLHGGKLVN